MTGDGNEDVSATLRMRFDRRLAGVQVVQDGKTPGLPPLTRELALGLLDDVLETLAPHLRLRVGAPEDEVQAIVEHDAIALMGQLRDAIDDLERGKTHAALQAKQLWSNATLSTEERKRRVAIIELAEGLRAIKSTPGRRYPQTRADNEIARALRKNRSRGAYEAITGAKIKSMRDALKRQKTR